MKVSSRVDYAISCVIRIAAKYMEQKPVPVKFIAEKENLESDYVEQLLITLKREGLLKSVRGVRGGYLLARPPEEISAFEIIKAFDGDILELVCFRNRGRRLRCIHLDNCQIQDFWKGLRESMTGYLQSHSLAELLELRMKEPQFTK